MSVYFVHDVRGPPFNLQGGGDTNYLIQPTVSPQIILPLKLYPGRFWDLLDYTPGYIPGAPRIYPSLPRSTPLPVICWSVFRSQNLSLPPRISPLFNKFICATLPESTPPSRNIPSFSTTICDPPRIYPSLPEYTLLFNNYMRLSQNLPLPPRIYPVFQELYATLPESTPSFQNIPPFPTTIILCDTLRIYPSLPEYTPLFNPFIYLIFLTIFYGPPCQTLNEIQWTLLQPYHYHE